MEGEGRGSLPLNAPLASLSAEDAARAALKVAKIQAAEVLAAIRDEKAAAERAIEERFAARLRGVRALVSEREGELRVAMDLLPDHPWTGKRVFKMVSRVRFWQHPPPTKEEGVVETVRSTSAFAANLSHYTRPEIGSAIVRPLKKDGSPGLGFDHLSQYAGWKLCDETDGGPGLLADPQQSPEVRGE